MKTIKLLFATVMLLFSAGAWAQSLWTDKTSVITNPSFETDDAVADLTKCGWATDRATGWTITPSSPGNAQVGIGNSSSTIQGIASSFSPSAGDKYFYMRENWNPNTTFSISQTIPDGSIPAGIYRLTVKAAMFSSVASTYTLSLQEEGQTAATNSFSYAGTANSETWRDWSVMLIKRADDTDLIITAAYKTPSENSSSKHYCLMLDDVKLEYLSGVSSTNTFDMTSWITNPSFELNTFSGTQAGGSSIGSSGGNINKPTGWTCFFNIEGWRDCTSNTTNPADGTYCMNAWFGTINEMKFYQTIDYLPEGVYEISAQVRTDQTETIGIYTYGIAGGNTYQSSSWDASLMAGTWNSMENWQTLTARASIVGGGSLQFGLRSDKFVQFDDFHLTYLGNNLLLSDLKSTFSTYQTTATSDLASATYTNVTGSERTDLTNAKNATPAENVEAWNTAVTTLRDAIDAFEAAKTNYDALVAEIAKAKALGIDDATADGYAATSLTTAATALTNTQDLKVAEYGYVNDNYEYGVDLGAWTTEGYTADNSGQHWDGTNSSKYKEQENSWGTPKKGYAADSWSIKFYQSIELPAGNYVFKVAGRKASGTHTTMSLDVTKTSDDTSLGSINDFPEGDTGLGINKSGATSFDPEDAAGFANSGAGRGWEWRYVKFTLPSTTEVKIAVNADADATSQWMSFCNYTLQTDDDKNISLIAYNVALSSAETIIADDRYENVTGSEKTALQDAIDDDEDLDKDDKDAIDAATTALEDATTAFVNAKNAYDAFVAAKAVVYEDNLPYASSSKFAAIGTAQGAAAATSASDATTKTNAIISAYRKYVESNALAEGVADAEDKTSLISDPNMEVTYDGTEHTFGAWQVFGQTDGNIQLLSSESFTDGSGKNDYKYADIYKSDNNAGIKQTLEDLDPGKYLLTVTARAATTAGATFGIFAGSKRTEITRIGNSGGVFDRGWNDASVEFFVTETSNVEIGVQSGNGRDLWWSATRFRLVRLGDASESVTVTPAGYATYASDYPLDFTSSGIKAYIATTKGDGTGVDFTQINKVPAGTGVLLYKAGGDKESIPFFSDSAEDTDGNVFVRGTGATVATEAGDYYNYILNNVRGNIGFYRAAGQTVATNRAYIRILKSGTPSPVKEFFSLPGFEDATAIENVNANVNDNNAVIYNVAGQRISKLQKGINIVNGKKILK